MKRPLFSLLFVGALLSASLSLAAIVVPSSVDQPGTQPGEVSNLESPDKCDNCHGGYNNATEPAFNWRGSMMANAGRDPIFWATLAIAEQDFDGAGDLCIRCHSTAGWLAGRSTPTDGSGLAAGDSDGVDCDYCHKMTDPADTDPILKGVMNSPFVARSPLSGEPFYGSGMFAIWGGSEKLGPYDDAEARHKFSKSKFHRSVDFCGTCHDVSNPVVGNLAHNFGAQPAFLANGGTVVADGFPNESPKDFTNKAAFNNPPYKYGVVERTFSEYKAGLVSQTLVNDYVNLPADLKGGALKAAYDAATLNGTRATANYADGDPRYFSCQTCHMRAVLGQGCNKNPPMRPDLPLHDMTGGNYWMPQAIKYLDGQSKLRLGGGLSSLQVAALDAGMLRAREQLQLAASLKVTGDTVKVVNHTGHKLISGYPEGRRMWLNIKWMDAAGTLIREDGKYGTMTVDIKGTPTQVKTLLDLNDTNTKVYEAHNGMDQGWAAQLRALNYPASLPLSYNRETGAVQHTLEDLAQAADGTVYETFHFVLNNVVYKDNRIPPYGMNYNAARDRNALPVPASQYNGAPGGTYDYFDNFALNVPSGAVSATIDLLYQPTSWEYIQFLYLGNKGIDPAQGGNAFLGQEGDYMLEAWLNTGMAEPYVMASTTWGTPPVSCGAQVPTLLAATPGNASVALSWNNVHNLDANVTGYSVYYDQAGKSQLITDLGLATSFTNTGLTNGQQYCYKVTSRYANCASGFSNILCATPTNQGQARAGATLATGLYEKSGKGKNATTVFVSTTTFTVGNAVTVRALVLNGANDLPIANATVNIAVSGPAAAALVTGPSNASGIAEATWQTQAPNRKGQGGTPTGSYTATTTYVTATGYSWDGAGNPVNFTLQ